MKTTCAHTIILNLERVIADRFGWNSAEAEEASMVVDHMGQAISSCEAFSHLSDILEDGCMWREIVSTAAKRPGR